MLSKRESQLIELLLEEENFQPASFFSEKLNVSNKTIYQDTNTLTRYLMFGTTEDQKKYTVKDGDTIEEILRWIFYY